MILYTDRTGIRFQIDEGDYEAVSHYPWRVHNKRYICTTVGRRPTRRKLLLHEFLLGSALEGMECDHINRDKFDNRRSNLRFVSPEVNARNVGLRRHNKSGVIGVHYEPSRHKWVMQIACKGQKRRRCVFDGLEAAVIARHAAELELWGNAR